MSILLGSVCCRSLVVVLGMWMGMGRGMGGRRCWMLDVVLCGLVLCGLLLRLLNRGSVEAMILDSWGVVRR